VTPSGLPPRRRRYYQNKDSSLAKRAKSIYLKLFVYFGLSECAAAPGVMGERLRKGESQHQHA
jgi:hypothetical protein